MAKIHGIDVGMIFDHLPQDMIGYTAGGGITVVITVAITTLFRLHSTFSVPPIKKIYSKNTDFFVC